MTQTFIPTGDNTLLKDAVPLRKIGRLDNIDAFKVQPDKTEEIEPMSAQ